MKIFTYTILAMIFSLSGCSSQKQLLDTPPFEIGQAVCQTWVGGRPESGSGIKLDVPVLSDNVNGIKMQQAFFRGKIAAVKLDTKNGERMIKANFLNNSQTKPDIIAHGDATKEVGNQPPKLQEKFPFKIANDECVVSYLDGATLKYFKIKGIKELEPLIYK